MISDSMVRIIEIKCFTDNMDEFINQIYIANYKSDSIGIDNIINM